MRPLVLATLGALALSALACSKGRPPVHYLDRVEVAGATVEDNALLALTPEDVRQLLEQSLAPPSFARLRPDQTLPEGARLYRATLELAFTREATRADSDERWAEVGASLTLRRVFSEARETFEVSGVGEEEVVGVDLEGRQLAHRRALAQALEQVALEARLQLDAVTRSDEALVKELASEDERVREIALQILAARGHPAAGPLLIRRLGAEDLGEVRQAMGALVEMRVEEAVPPLIDLARGRDPLFERELLFAISGIGGEEARAYLFTVAQGHDEPSVRAAAQEAFEELSARERSHAEAKRPAAQ